MNFANAIMKTVRFQSESKGFQSLYSGIEKLRPFVLKALAEKDYTF